MIELFEHLNAIESAKGSNAKKALLATACKDEYIKEVIGKALDPRFPMYLGREAKFPIVNVEDMESAHDPCSLSTVMTSLNTELIKRGGEAKKVISEVMSSIMPYDDRISSLHISDVHLKAWAPKWIPRLVTKDLQIGVSWETFTKVNGEKKFAVMLAKDINKIKNLEKKFTFPVYVQPKLDGYRAIANTSAEQELRSRNGKQYGNFPTILEALSKILPRDIILDGEIMSDDFQAMQKTAFNQSGESTGAIEYHVFDCITRDEWLNREGEFTFEERQDSLVNLVGRHPLVKIVLTKECHNWEEVYEAHAVFLARGYEGTMVRANVPYQFKRTDSLAKIKEMLSMDCEVLSVEEGRNSLVGSMGKINVRQENDVECGVGSGFDLPSRKEILDKEDLFIGRIAEIKYQELTKDGVMRFPVFMRWRDDK